MKGLVGFIAVVAMLLGVLAISVDHAANEHDHEADSLGTNNVEQRALADRIPIVIDVQGSPTGRRLVFRTAPVEGAYFAQPSDEAE